MNIIKTEDFQKFFVELPGEIQRLYQSQEERFIVDCRDPRLHIKKVKELSLAYSFRVTRRYRVLFYFQNTAAAVFFAIDHRKDVYR